MTATLNGGTRTEATVVTIGTLAGTATKDTDYTLTITPTDDSVVEGDEIIMVPGTTLASITIPANTASGSETLTITPTDDQIVEGDETITIPGTTTVTGLSVTSATVTLTDDDGTTSTPTDDKDSADLSITGPSANVAEGSDATFTVTLSAGVASQVQVAWTATGNTDDYSPDSGTVTFAAGSAAGATQNITITATDDALSETAESFTVTLGTITTTLPSAQVTLKSGAVRHGHHRRKRPHHRQHQRPLHRGRGRRDDRLHREPVAVGGEALGGPDRELRNVGRHGHGGDGLHGGVRHAHVHERGGRVADLHGEHDGGHLRRVRRDVHRDHFQPLGRRWDYVSRHGHGDDDDHGRRLPVWNHAERESVEPRGGRRCDYRHGHRHAERRRHADRGDGGDHRDAVGHGDEGHGLHGDDLASITIPANATSASGTLELTPTDDAIVEGDETITISGTTTVGLSVSSATITLTDDDKTTTTPTDDKDSAELSIIRPVGERG